MSETNDLLGGDFSGTMPSAPAADDNGFYVVEDKQQVNKKVDDLVNAVADAVNSGKEEMSKLISEVADTQNRLTGSNKVVYAEPDSSTSSVKSEPTKNTTDGCTACPYYKLACEKLSNVKIPARVEDYILWKDPKVTGVFFASALVLLISLASFSLLSVVSTTAMLVLSATGAYRFYLAVLFRIKGIQDETFEKLTNFNVAIPKEKFQEITRMLEADINRLLVQAKAIILWENMPASGISLLVLYCVYCVGSVFNTITLAILVLVSVFTLPKVYQVYKKPIDAALDQASLAVHKVVKQVMEKLPFLKKKAH